MTSRPLAQKWQLRKDKENLHEAVYVHEAD